MPETPSLQSLAPLSRSSVADQAFEELHRQILSLDLTPGARMSEADVAKALGVSRQPVRDAFFRLSKLGFLEIRPQRATTVSLISCAAVLQAQFVRTALESEVMRAACRGMPDSFFGVLDDVLRRQKESIKENDRAAFHAQDDELHQKICEGSQCAFVWPIIRENKAHIDRARVLSLSFNAERTYQEHVDLVAALKARDQRWADRAIRQHLHRIEEELDRIRSEHEAFFADEPAATTAEQ